MIVRRSKSAVVVLLVLATGVAQAADNLYHWRCPYTPDGACPPQRQTYGHFGTKWNRWPGVTNADYESKIPPGSLSPPEGPREVAPRFSPDEMILPPDPTRDRDDAPTPPSGNGDAPALTPEADPRPDILSPPAEEAMDELLPDEATEQPEATPEVEPDPLPQFPEVEAPESGTPGNEDPFKDDPLFQDDPPAPPAGTGGSRYPSRLPGPGLPAMHGAPVRLPSASRSATFPAVAGARRSSSGVRTVASRGDAVRPRSFDAAGDDRLAQATAPSNPLRSSSSEPLQEREGAVQATAAWQQLEPVERAIKTAPRRPENPLRR